MSSPSVSPSCTVYSKPNCPLCDHLKDELNSRGIAFDERNIVLSEELFARYQSRIPVVVGPDGREFDPPFSDHDYDLWSRGSR